MGGLKTLFPEAAGETTFDDGIGLYQSPHALRVAAVRNPKKLGAKPLRNIKKRSAKADVRVSVSGTANVNIRVTVETVPTAHYTTCGCGCRHRWPGSDEVKIQVEKFENSRYARDYRSRGRAR